MVSSRSFVLGEMFSARVVSLIASILVASSRNLKMLARGALTIGFTYCVMAFTSNYENERRAILLVAHLAREFIDSDDPGEQQLAIFLVRLLPGSSEAARLGKKWKEERCLVSSP